MFDVKFITYQILFHILVVISELWTYDVNQ